MRLSNLSKEDLVLVSNTIRMLSADGVERANSGHPGMPMGAADYGAVLFLKYLRFYSKDVHWLNRDRFVLSNGHGSMFLYSMLHLCGYDMTLDDLKNFRQWGSRTPGHPEKHLTPGVECTTGPLGQGITNAVGMALGEQLLAARYNTDACQLVNHHVYCFVGDGCLMEGISSEASSIAGHLGLGNLIVLYDDNHISIAGHTELAFTEDVLKRYEGYNWHTQRVDGHNFEQVDKAIQAAIDVRDRPSIIACRTLIGKGSPNKVDTHEVHGTALGKEEIKLTKQALNWPLEPEFYIPDRVKQIFAERNAELKKVYDEWQVSFSSWKKSNATLAQGLERQLRRGVSSDLQAKLLGAVPKDGKAVATRKLSQGVLQVASREVNALVGGSADLEPSTLTLINGSTDIKKGSFSGLNIRFGVREHGMGGIMNGLSYYGGFIPYGSTFLCFADYMRPAIRLAALSHLPGLFIFTHDSIFLGEDGPTHQPIEHLNALRLIPRLWVIRPADGVETAIAYELALKRTDGPCCLIFTRQNLEPIERSASFDVNEIRRGAYSVYENGGNEPSVVFVSTGSEVSLAIAAAKMLGSTKTRVVSMPCWELFAEQPQSFRDALIPKASKKVFIEAGSTLCWPGMLGCDPADLLCIGIDQFGASAPQKVLAEKFGFTPEQVTERVKAWATPIR